MADERDLYETMLAGLLDWVWGKGKADIQRQIQQATPDTLATVIGHIAYALVQQGAEQGEAAGHEFSMDMLMGVATEIIESLEKMAAAMNMQFDAQAVALQALTQALNDYADSLPDGSQAQQEAREALKELNPQDFDDASSTLAQIGERNGVNPFAQDGGAAAPAQSASPAPQQGGLMGAAR
jgi:hypothetical protein